MKKIFILLAFVSLVLGLQKKVEAADDRPIISATQNAILANVGDVIDLSDYVYQHNATTFIEFDQVTLTGFSAGISLSGTQVTVSQKGQHPFLLQYQSANIYVYVVAKAVNETEYVLFETGFDAVPNGKLPNGYSTVTGSSGIQNEQLLVAGRGGSAIVTLPNYLRSFMNYIIEVDMTIVEVDNDARWASVMFRYSTENYYQMAIRKDATLANGVEFAKRINGAWNVTNTAAFSEQISPVKMYNLKIDVLDATVKEYINDQLLITHEQALEYKRGLIGVQTNGANALFDNFKITMPVSYIRTETFEFTRIPTIYEPNTKIVNPATIVTPLESMAQLSTYTSRRPATMVLNVNSDMDVVNSSDEKIDSLYNVLIALDGKYIPAFKVESAPLAVEIAERIKLWGILDVFFISTQKEVILAARGEYEMIRGVLDLSQRSFSSKADLDQIRKDTNSAQSVAVILNPAFLNKGHVNYLQQRLVTVWSSAENNTESHYNVLLSGANGIITDNPMALLDIYETFTTTTHLREVFIIAHRGLHNGYTESSGPENSIEVALQAYQNGAKIIETDVHLTFDEEVVVMHDTTTGRTASQNFTVSAQLLGALENITLLDVSNTGKTFYIPSLDSYLEAFKDKDVVLFIEIKPTNQRLLEKVRDKVLEKDMENKVVLIHFGAQNIVNMKTVMPTMVNGYLTGALLNSNSIENSMLSVLTSIVPMKSTLNPSYGQLTPEFTKALTHRGITVWPWTIDDGTSMSYYYNAGVGGITTNVSDYFKDMYMYLNYQTTEFEVVKGEPFILSGELKTKGGFVYPYRTELVILRNDANATFDGSGKLISVDELGEVVFYTKAISTLPNGSVIEIYSDLMTITFVEPSATLWSNPWIYVGFSGVSVLAVGIWFTLKKVTRK
jgi:glycerophosphoryl diester phosphodiesterase